MSSPLKDALKAGLAVIAGWVAGAYVFTNDGWRSVLSWWFVYFLAVFMVSSFVFSLKRQRES